MSSAGSEITRELDRRARGARTRRPERRISRELAPNSLTVGQVLTLPPRELADRLAAFYCWVFEPGRGVYTTPSARGVSLTTRSFNPADRADDDRLALQFLKKHHSRLLVPLTMAMLDLCRSRAATHTDGVPRVAAAHVPIYAHVGDYSRALILLASSAWWEATNRAAAQTKSATQRPAGQEVHHAQLTNAGNGEQTTKHPDAAPAAPGPSSNGGRGGTPDPQCQRPKGSQDHDGPPTKGL